MKRIPKWYVITGGPDSGKTTTINYLSNLGYYIVPEYARFLIEKELAKGKTLEEIRKDEIRFQDRVLKGKLQFERKAPKNKTVFLDRGVPDSSAYYYFLKTNPPKNLLRIYKNRYKKIFLLDMLPYKKDRVRDESKKDAMKIHRLLKQVYKDLGYKIIRVPVMTVEGRVKLILNNIE